MRYNRKNFPSLRSNEGFMSDANSDRKIRVLVAKPGLDGHDRGAKVVARALRDAGMEVIYTGLRQTPEMVAESALQEDVDAVGLSILSGAHMALVPRVLELLKANGQEHVKVFIGGIIPDEDAPRLKELGVVGVYGPGTITDDIIRDIRRAVRGETSQAPRPA
jgi:methylmalonyl-CoA mutase C-terminal domain/subunit